MAVKKGMVAIVAVLVIAGGAVLLFSHKGKTNGTVASTNTAGYTAVSACSVLTSSVAGQILGSTATKATSPLTQTGGSDVVFDQCIYTAGPTADPPHTASVAVRSAKNSTGATSNKAMFTSTGQPAGAQNVTGYGSAAYWDPSLGQLDILKGNNWYIISNYTGTSPANGTATLEMAEQLAQAVTLQ